MSSSDYTNLRMLKTPNFKLLTHLLIKCNTTNSNESGIIAISVEDRGDYCPRAFNGFACWYEPPDAKSYFRNCPEYFVGFDPRRYSFNQCSWITNQSYAIPWTSMSACVDTNDFNFMDIINSIHMSGYCISTVALVISIMIMTRFKSLHCIRNTIHIHLFTAFIFNNLCWILTYATVVNDPSMMIENKAWCQILHVVTHYFTLTDYSWMFCEGLHLYLSLAVVYLEEKFSMRLFKFIGWVVPAFIVAAYAIKRHYTPGATESGLHCSKDKIIYRRRNGKTFYVAYFITTTCLLTIMFMEYGVHARKRLVAAYTCQPIITCWIEDSDAMWIIDTPVLGSVLALVGFLVYIIRVLMNKMKTHSNESNLTTIMKGARATMMLIPLFGLHFVLIPFRSYGETIFEKIYDVLSAVVVSFQGVYISVLFCFTHHEVITAFKNYFWRLRNARDAERATGITGADSMQHIQENIM